MSKSSITVRDVFEVPKEGADKSEGWKTFEERVKEELKGAKTAALPDIAEKVGELFDIPIPDIFLNSWRKASELQSVLDESRSAPKTVMNTELGEHTINSLHHPSIEVRIQRKTVKKIEFTLKLTFDLKGFVLKIQNGAIRGMQSGICEVKGKLEYQDLVIFEKKMAPITLPGVVSFEGGTIAAPPGTPKQPEVKEQKATAETKPDIVQDAGETKPPEMTHEAGSTTNEVAEGKAQEVAEASTSETSAALVDVEESPPLQPVEPAGPVEIAPQGVGDTATEVEERDTWEVGDDEEDSAPTPAATKEVVGEASSEAPAAGESPQHVIEKMSRELADSRQTGDEVSEIKSSAKAGS